MCEASCLQVCARCGPPRLVPGGPDLNTDRQNTLTMGNRHTDSTGHVFHVVMATDTWVRGRGTVTFWLKKGNSECRVPSGQDSVNCVGPTPTPCPKARRGALLLASPQLKWADIVKNSLHIIEYFHAVLYIFTRSRILGFIYARLGPSRLLFLRINSLNFSHFSCEGFAKVCRHTFPVC